MELDHRTELGSLIGMSCCFSARLRTAAPHRQLGHAHPHITGSRVAVRENKALSRKGWLR